MLSFDNLRRYSYEEYMDVEQMSQLKHEFYDGHILPVMGDTIGHNLIKGNICAFYRTVGKNRTCRCYMGMKFQIEAEKIYTYPDITMTCDNRDNRHPYKTFVEYPSLVMEITSGQTALLDTVGKLRIYQTIPSVWYYLVINQYRPEVTVHNRMEGLWEKQVFTNLGEVIELDLLGFGLPLKSIYGDVKFV